MPNIVLMGIMNISYNVHHLPGSLRREIFTAAKLSWIYFQSLALWLSQGFKRIKLIFQGQEVVLFNSFILILNGQKRPEMQRFVFLWLTPPNT